MKTQGFDSTIGGCFTTLKKSAVRQRHDDVGRCASAPRFLQPAASDGLQADAQAGMKHSAQVGQHARLPQRRATADGSQMIHQHKYIPDVGCIEIH